MAAVNTESIPTSHTNGVIEDGYDEEDKSKVRPVDIDADMREMKRRHRVEQIMNSRLFREELERIIESQIKAGSSSFGLLQQISDIVGSRYSFNNHINRSSNCTVPINDIRGVEAVGYGKGEKILRCKLAALFRLIDLFGWSQGIYNHVTARLSQKEEHFLVNPYGLLYNEITASSLAKVDMQGNVIETGTTNFAVNVGGFQLHAAIYAARPDLNCIVHLHTPAVLTVSALKDGLLPICQEAAVIGDVSQHTYIGIPNEPEERDKIARNLGPNNKVIFLTNHGVLCCGKTIEEAFFNVYNTVNACETELKLLPLGKDNLVLLTDETKKNLYDAARKLLDTIPPPIPNILAARKIHESEQPPAEAAKEVSKLRWHIGELEFEALMRMLDNAGFRTGYVYRQPLIKGEVQRPKDEVELPPAVSSLGYLLEEEELYKQGQWRKQFGTKGNDRIRWLNSPNVYQKVEILETGTTDPKKITKWVDANNEEWVAEGSPSHTSTPVKIDNALQFVPKNTNPKEFKKLQQQIKENRRADKITSGPQSHILEGVSWEEAKKLQDANMSGTGDQVILVGAASKGIIQREFQHNATVYKTPYAKNPFDAITDEEIETYKKDITRKQRGDSYYEEDESDALSSSLPPSGKQNIIGITSETEDESLTHDLQVIQTEKSTAPKASHAEIVLSDGKTSRKSKNQKVALFKRDFEYTRPANVFLVKEWEIKKFCVIVAFNEGSLPRPMPRPSLVIMSFESESPPRCFDSSEIEYTIVTEISGDFSSTDEEEPPAPLSAYPSRSASLSSIKSYIGGEYEEMKPSLPEVPAELTSSITGESDDTSQDEQTVIAMPKNVVVSSDVEDVESISNMSPMSSISNFDEVIEVSDSSSNGEAYDTFVVNDEVEELEPVADTDENELNTSSVCSSEAEDAEDNFTYYASDYIVDPLDNFLYVIPEESEPSVSSSNEEVSFEQRRLRTLPSIPEERVEEERQDEFVKSLQKFVALRDIILQRLNNMQAELTENSCATWDSSVKMEISEDVTEQGNVDLSEPLHCGLESSSSVAVAMCSVDTDDEGVRNVEHADSDAQTISDRSMVSFLADSYERIYSEAALDSGVLTEDYELVSASEDVFDECGKYSEYEDFDGFFIWRLFEEPFDEGLLDYAKLDDGHEEPTCNVSHERSSENVESEGKADSGVFSASVESNKDVAGTQTNDQEFSTDGHSGLPEGHDRIEDEAKNVVLLGMLSIAEAGACVYEPVDEQHVNYDATEDKLKHEDLCGRQNDEVATSDTCKEGYGDYEVVRNVELVDPTSTIDTESKGSDESSSKSSDNKETTDVSSYTTALESLDQDVEDHLSIPGESAYTCDTGENYNTNAEEKTDTENQITPIAEAKESNIVDSHDDVALHEPTIENDNLGSISRVDLTKVSGTSIKDTASEMVENCTGVTQVLESDLGMRKEMAACHISEITESFVQDVLKTEPTLAPQTAFHPFTDSEGSKVLENVSTDEESHNVPEHGEEGNIEESGISFGGPEMPEERPLAHAENIHSKVPASPANEFYSLYVPFDVIDVQDESDDISPLPEPFLPFDFQNEYTEFRNYLRLSYDSSRDLSQPENCSDNIMNRRITSDQFSHSEERETLDHESCAESEPTEGDNGRSNADFGSLVKHTSSFGYDVRLRVTRSNTGTCNAETNTPTCQNEEASRKMDNSKKHLLTVRLKVHHNFEKSISTTDETHRSDSRLSLDENSSHSSNQGSSETFDSTSGSETGVSPHACKRPDDEYDYPKFVLYNYFSPKMKIYYKRKNTSPVIEPKKVSTRNDRHKACFETSGAYCPYSKVCDLSFVSKKNSISPCIQQEKSSSRRSSRNKFKTSSPSVQNEIRDTKATFNADDLINNKLSPIIRSLDEFELLESLLAADG